MTQFHSPCSHIPSNGASLPVGMWEYKDYFPEPSSYPRGLLQDSPFFKHNFNNLVTEVYCTNVGSNAEELCKCSHRWKWDGQYVHDKPANLHVIMTYHRSENEPQSKLTPSVQCSHWDHFQVEMQKSMLCFPTQVGTSDGCMFLPSALYNT